MKIHAVSYATPGFRPWQSIWEVTARRVGVDQVHRFGPDDLDAGFVGRNRATLSVARGGGYWLWKPSVIARVLDHAEPGDVVVYTDAGAHFAGDPDRLVALLDEVGDVLVLGEGFSDAAYTKRDAFVLLECDEARYWDSPQRFAGVVVCRAAPKARALAADWLRAGEDPRILTDQPNEMGLENRPGFVAHRHDQSILSLLTKRAGITVPPNRLLREGVESGEHVLNHTRNLIEPREIAHRLVRAGHLSGTEFATLMAGFEGP